MPTWSIWVIATWPGQKRLGWRSTTVPLARTARACGPAMTMATRPWLWSTSDAVSASAFARRRWKSPSRPPSAIVSHWSGPAQRSATSFPVADWPGPGSAKPKPSRRAVASASPRPLRAMTVTIDSGWRSLRETPGPSGPCPLAPKRPAVRFAPSEIVRDGGAISAMELQVLPIIEAGVGHLDQHLGIAQIVIDLDDLGITLAAALQEREADPLPEHRRPGDRGDIALIVVERRHGAAGEEMGTGTQLLIGLDRLHPHQHIAVVCLQRLALAHHAADEILAARHHAAEAEILGGGGAVELAAGDMALLDAHDRQRLDAIGDDAEARAFAHQQARHPVAMVGGHRQLIGELAGEGDAEQSSGNPAGHRDGLGAEIGEGGIG